MGFRIRSVLTGVAGDGSHSIDLLQAQHDQVACIKHLSTHSLGT